MIAAARPGILNEFGQPYEAERSTPDLHELRHQKQIDGTYDAARSSSEYDTYWQHADNLDADSANSQAVRAKMVPRARYEVSNNGFVDGMVGTQADYMVGKGPSLRMQTGTAGFNQAVEVSFYKWAKAAQLRQKLWCMAHAKTQDGEALGLLVTNEAVADKVKLDLKLFETEQCQTPMLPIFSAGYIDGIKFDEFGNPEWYDVLPTHPGATTGGFTAFAAPTRVAAEFVVHWFKMRRPGQHRGVPELRSTLNTGASARRFREATVAAAETAAELNIVLSTNTMPDNGPMPVRPFSTMEIPRRAFTTAPMGWSANHVDSKHPNANYDGFNRNLISEQARPLGQSYNVAAADSSKHNFASGKLDAQGLFGKLDIERLDCDDAVLEKLFRLWWREAVVVYGWKADRFEPPAHDWNWPRHPIADEVSSSNAVSTRLKSGTLTLTKAYADMGLDFEDAVIEMAGDYGVTVEEMRGILLRTHFPGAMNIPVPGAAPPAPSQPSTPAASDDEGDTEEETVDEEVEAFA